MSILITAMAIAATQGPAAASPASAPAPAAHVHAQPAQPGSKPHGEGCSCCEKMVGGGKMECCAKHGQRKAGEHSGHSAHR